MVGAMGRVKDPAALARKLRARADRQQAQTVEEMKSVLMLLASRQGGMKTKKRPTVQ